MAKTGPQRYPGASTAYWHQGRYPGSAMETNVIVWHSTEGTTLPTYSGGANAPNFTAVPDFARQRLVWYQHFDFDVSSRALRNLGGGVETNTANVCQVEVVGTCDPAAHGRWGAGRPHLYMPELPDWAIRDLAAFARWAHEQHGVRLDSGLTFKSYPASYGTNGVRMTSAAWRGFYGHCGHQHVPENDHGDPGALPMAAILAAAKGDDSTDRETGDDVPEHIYYERKGPVILTPGDWYTVTWDRVWRPGVGWKDRDLAQTLLSGANVFSLDFALRAKGLAPGQELQMRVGRNSRKEGGGWGRAKSWPINSPVHSGGDGHFTHHWGGFLPAYDDNRLVCDVLVGGTRPITVDQLTASLLYWPA